MLNPGSSCSDFKNSFVVNSMILTNALQLTRTIWVSCLSHFLLLLLHSRQICNGRSTWTRASTRNLIPAPWQISGSETDCTAKLRQCPQLKFCTVIVYRLRLNLYRDTRNAHKTLYLDGKKCAIPSLHRDSILAPPEAGYQDSARMLRRVTQPPHIAGPLAATDNKKI